MDKRIKPIPKTKRGRERRAQILDAAEEVFSEIGFNAASIADITKRAGTAQGTLYIYFNSKEEIFREVMLELGRQIRQVASNATEDSTDRIDAEIRGLDAYLRFVVRRPSTYRIVQQCAVVDRATWREFYQTVTDNYSSNLQAAADRGELAFGDAEVRAWIMIGIATVMGERVSDWGNSNDIDRIVNEFSSLLRFGIAKRDGDSLNKQ